MVWTQRMQKKVKEVDQLVAILVINNWTNPFLHDHLIRHCVGMLQGDLIVIQLGCAEIPSPPSASLILYSSSWEEWSRPSRTSLSLYVSFSNLVLWLTYLHTWSPDPALQRYYNDRYVVVVSPTVAMWYLDQFMEVHSCHHKACEKQDQWLIRANSSTFQKFKSYCTTTTKHTRYDFSIPALFAALKRTSSTRCWAGSPSGVVAMNISTWATASSLVKYW